MSQQKLLQTTNSCFTPQIRCRFLRSRPPRRRPRFLPVGALVSSRRFAGAIFSLAVAIQLSARIALLRRAKARYICFEIPRFRVPNSEPGISARQGVTRWQSALGGRAWSIANPFPIRIVQINYCALSSAADSCRSACRAERLASFSAACSCRNFVSCRWYSALNSCVFRTFLFCGHLNPCNSSAYIVLPVIFSSRRRSARNRRPLP